MVAEADDHDVTAEDDGVEPAETGWRVQSMRAGERNSPGKIKEPHMLKTNLRTKSVWSPIKPEDGLRILATRFRGHGLRKTRYHIWMASLGPSESLLRSVAKGTRTWAAFAREYKRELFLDGPVDKQCRTIKNHGQKFTLRLIKRLASKGNVTLLCHCPEDEGECHRHLLRKIILSPSV